MRKQFTFCIDLPHGIYDVEGKFLAEDGRLIEWTMPDGTSHEPTRQPARSSEDHILRLVQAAITAKYAIKIDETREPERADTAPVLV